MENSKKQLLELLTRKYREITLNFQYFTDKEKERALLELTETNDFIQNLLKEGA